MLYVITVTNNHNNNNNKNNKFYENNRKNRFKHFNGYDKLFDFVFFSVVVVAVFFAFNCGVSSNKQGKHRK